MGLVFSNIILSNPQTDKLKPVEVKCLVDSGATHLIIPANISVQLELKEHEKREVILADGSVKLVPYVGPIKISFDNKKLFGRSISDGGANIAWCYSYGRYGPCCASKIISINC